MERQVAQVEQDLPRPACPGALELISQVVAGRQVQLATDRQPVHAVKPLG